MKVPLGDLLQDIEREESVCFVVEYSGDVFEVELLFREGVLRGLFIESSRYRVLVTLPTEEHHHELVVEPQSMSHLVASLNISRGWVESVLSENYGASREEARRVAELLIQLLMDALLDTVEEIIREGIVLAIERS